MKLFNKVTTIQQAIAHYLKANPTIANSLDKMGADVAVSGLPSEYDNVPYSTVINGKWVETVGEYKAECAKSNNY